MTAEKISQCIGNAAIEDVSPNINWFISVLSSLRFLSFWSDCKVSSVSISLFTEGNCL